MLFKISEKIYCKKKKLKKYKKREKEEENERERERGGERDFICVQKSLFSTNQPSQTIFSSSFFFYFLAT